MSQSYERRRSPRVRSGVLAHELCPVGPLPCRVTNISETGAYLQRLLGGVFLEGEMVHLSISLSPDGGDGSSEDEPLWVVGRVVEQVDEPLHDAAAVRFVDLSGAERGRLRRYVAARRQERLREALVGLGGAERLAAGAEHRPAAPRSRSRAA